MRQAVYNLAARFSPRLPERKLEVVECPEHGSTMESFRQNLARILHYHRVYGASFALFNKDGIIVQAVYGNASGNQPVAAGTFFRVASVSKMITAAGVMAMRQAGVLDIDIDVKRFLPYADRIQREITLRSMLTHSAGFHDGAIYNQLIGTGATLDKLMVDESVQPENREPIWEYSNFGAGLIAVVLEEMLGQSFEVLMQKYLFKPLQAQASLYPQHLDGLLANAYQMLPYRNAPRFHAQERKSRTDIGWDKVDHQHYGLAQGNCCINTSGMHKIAGALMAPGFLLDSTLRDMQAVHGSFGKRDSRLKQGIGLFIVEDQTIAPYPLYGHQGLAYGAVHGVFFDTEYQDGMILLTSGASLARDGVLTNLNADVMKLWQERQWMN